ncbi:hypothetical protein [Carnobacterium maltaromaticum]|uniref:hypothetical protein n=1 Tax=Carnobacterium maltaromaticum TaxID=2751 RepID=UPI001D25A651|nr:hypothetical protein [Carnobacterium maltaromaticum]MCC4310738.1 hypothetical protein [Carnobacterium maltaromaticum]
MDIFLNNAGEFQWLSISAIGSFVGVLIATFFSLRSNKKTINNQKTVNEESLKMQRELNEKNIEANIISKARIEWIQSVRNDVAEYIAVIYSIHAHAYQFMKDDELISEDRRFLKEQNRILDEEDDYTKDYEHFMLEHGDSYKYRVNKLSKSKEKIDIDNFKILEFAEKIILKFSDNEEHKKIEEIVMWFPLRTKDFKDKIKEEKHGESEEILNEFNNHVFMMRNIFREYFKQEWEVAKGERLT